MKTNQQQQVGSPTNIASSANVEPPVSTRSYDLKDSLAGFLQVISKSSRGQQNIDDILTQAQNSFRRAEQVVGKTAGTGNDNSVDAGSTNNVAAGEAKEEAQEATKVEAGVEAKVEAEVEAGVEAEADPRVEVGVDPRVEVGVDSDGEAEEEADGEAEEEADGEAEEEADEESGEESDEESHDGSDDESDDESDVESDIDPDNVELGAQERVERVSKSRVGERETDRNIRARRRAAQAEGQPVPADIMINRKPITKEQKEEVTLKVRNARVLYTFVKSREESFRGLRKELELLAELPRHLKFELQYQSKPIQDSDTPAALGINLRGRLRVKRKVIADDESSDDVTEVDRKKRRSNLLKLTIQDEKGRKHDFQHDRDTKLGSMFRAFARLCQNDVYSYRFFLDGVRLTNDDKPTDHEEFEDGALIDAFFEAQGGSRHVHSSPHCLKMFTLESAS